MSLDKTYSAENINRAAREAIGLQSYSYRTVKTLCSLTPFETAAETTAKKPGEKHRYTRSLDEYQKQLELILN